MLKLTVIIFQFLRPSTKLSGPFQVAAIMTATMVVYKSQNGYPRQIFSDGLLSIRMSKISYQALSINLLGICIVCAAKLIATVNFAALRIWTGDGVRKQHSTDHSRHNHNKNWQDFQETSQDRSCFCMGVILSTKGSLDNNLNCMNSIRD